MKKLKLKKSIVSDLSKISDLGKIKGGELFTLDCETKNFICLETQFAGCVKSVNSPCRETEQPNCTAYTYNMC